MSKSRIINTKFWSDNFIVQINPLDRYLFLYFLTNEHTNICGIYELAPRVMAFETGLEQDMLLNMIERLKGKIYYIENWVCIKNFSKHQADNNSVRIGIKNGLALVPPHILERFKQLVNADSLSEPVTETEILELKLKPELKPKHIQAVEFEEFWKIYPKHVGKQKSKQYWNQLSFDDQVKAIQDIPKRKTDRKWLGGFIKDPERYIKNRQWEDDIILEQPKKVERGVDSFIKK